MSVLTQLIWLMVLSIVVIMVSTIEELKEFHRPRIQILLKSSVDLLALETIPNRLEAQALIELLAEEFPESEAYLSFTVQESGTIS